VIVEIVFTNKRGSNAHPIFAAVWVIEPFPPTIAVRRYTMTVDTIQIPAAPIRPPRRIEITSISVVISTEVT